MIESPDLTWIEARGREIYRKILDAGYRQIDRMFTVLLVAEWAAAILLALIYSPLAWAGSSSEPHLHLWVALILGGAVVSLPIALTLGQPGRASTRSCVAAGQMLMVVLLIHLAGGRPEFHFHVFVSLAFLALYRDWKILAIGGAVVAVDHFLRGIYWPRSVFGILVPNRWRWVEHAVWVVFEAGVLSFAINRALASVLEAAARQAQIEATRDRVELLVAARTIELKQANEKLRVEISERRDAENEALLARNLAEEATRIKSQFLANMSHEIRTPINAIIGMTELTLDLDMPVDQRENLQIVLTAAHELLVIVEATLDFSKTETNELELDSIPFSVRSMIEEVRETLAGRASEKGLLVSTRIAGEIPSILRGDPYRLRQILLNLVGNAIKFTERGRVDLSLEIERAGADGLILHFAVADEGIGIPKSCQAMIFEPFMQADGSTTRRFGGTGLGLSICSRLINLMGGGIWVESEVGRGSTFHFTARVESVSQDDRRLVEAGASAMPKVRFDR